MEFDELLITTGVDALVRLVREKKKIELTIAGQLLDIPSQTLEEWGHVLEEEGIIKIEYSIGKIFFVWIEPTAEQIASEREVFYKEQRGLEDEIKTVKMRLEPETMTVENLKTEFSQLYERLYPKLEELEKKFSSLPSTEGAFGQYTKKVEDIQIRITTLEKTNALIKSDFDNLVKQFTSLPKFEPPSVSEIENFKNNLKKMRDELEGLKEEVKQVSLSLPKEMPTTSDIKKRVERLQVEFTSFKRATATLRTDFQGLKESSDIVNSIGTSIKKYEDDLAEMNKETELLSKAIVDIKKRSNLLAEKINGQEEIVNRFGDSINVTKEVITKFPSQKEFEARLSELTKIENATDEKLAAVSKLISSFSAPNTLLARFERLKGEIDIKIAEMEKHAENIQKAVEEEKITYETFQKIKERAMVSIAAYNSQLRELNSEITRIKKDAEAAKEKLSKELVDYSKTLDRSEIEETIKTTKVLKEKRELLDQISSSIESLSSNADNLNKRLALLAKHASLLELRVGESKLEEKQELEIRNQITLSKNEEEEFRKKRDELRDLIKKLWEESS